MFVTKVWHFLSRWKATILNFLFSETPSMRESSLWSYESFASVYGVRQIPNIVRFWCNDKDIARSNCLYWKIAKHAKNCQIFLFALTVWSTTSLKFVHLSTLPLAVLTARSTPHTRYRRGLRQNTQKPLSRKGGIISSFVQRHRIREDTNSTFNS